MGMGREALAGDCYFGDPDKLDLHKGPGSGEVSTFLSTDPQSQSQFPFAVPHTIVQTP